MLRTALALGVLILSSLFSFANAEAIAKVVALYGAPTASGRALSEGSAINEHDKITVGSGNVQILFNDGTKLVIGSNSTLVIEKYLMKGASTAQNLSIDALRGTFRFITGGSAKKAYHIKTANSTIGIRGTGFDFWVNKDTGVVVLQGKVNLSRGSSSVNINAGCQAGIAQSDKTQLLKPAAGSNLIRIHLPFILNQSYLRPAFRLNVASCANVLSLTEPTQGHSCQQSCTQTCNYQTAGLSNCTTTCSCQ
jgi:hypothetical protein